MRLLTYSQLAKSWRQASLSTYGDHSPPQTSQCDQSRACFGAERRTEKHCN